MYSHVRGTTGKSEVGRLFVRLLWPGVQDVWILLFVDVWFQLAFCGNSMISTRAYVLGNFNLDIWKLVLHTPSTRLLLREGDSVRGICMEII